MSDRPTPTARVRAITIGYQGMGNTGDEAILSGIERVLAQTRVRIETVVAGPQAVPAAREATRLPMPRWLPSLDLLRAFRRSDLLIIAGGGLVNDYWRTLIPRYLLLTGMARLLGCRVAWVGVGAGPIRRHFWRWLTRRLVAVSNLFAVRDEGSLTTIRRITDAPQVRLAPDPAWFNVAPAGVEPTDGLGIVLRGPAPRDERDAEPLFDAIAEVMADHAAAGTRATLVTMQADADRAAISAIRQRLEPRGLTVELVRLPLEATAAIGRLARFEAVISVRLHGLVLASLAGRPCLPLVYDPKVAAAANQLGLGEIALPIAGATADRIEGALREVTSEAVQRTVRERVREITARRSEIAAAIESVL